MVENVLEKMLSEAEDMLDKYGRKVMLKVTRALIAARETNTFTK